MGSIWLAAQRARLARCAQLFCVLCVFFVGACGGGGGDYAESTNAAAGSGGETAASPDPAPEPDVDNPAGDNPQVDDPPADDSPGADAPPPADEPDDADDDEAPGAPPVADAGLDTSVSELTSVALDGHASRAADGELMAYRWQQLSGAPVTIDDPLAPRTGFIAPSVAASELLSFELTVTDSAGNADVDTIDITVVEAQEVPGDPDEFLSWLDDLSAPYVGSEQSAAAYYEAVDPLNEKTNLADWLSFNGFDDAPDARAVYRNAADLGFGRIMSLRTLADGGVAAYVENYPTLNDAVTAADTGDRSLLLATVAMEFSPGPDGGDPYTKFYTFGPDDARITSIDLDGRGAKFVPGLCNVCHGGQPQPLAGSEYPDGGATAAQFLPWDLETYEFSDVDGYTRADQAAALKALNAGALSTYPDGSPAAVAEGHWSGSAARELIEGWYGGAGLPGDFDPEFVPQGWRAEVNGGPAGNPSGIEDLYLDVIAPNCRACHIMRGRYFSEHAEGELIDFAGYAKFMAWDDVLEDLLYDSGVMPDALVTFTQFWTNHDGVVGAEALAGFLGVDATQQRPGRPIADAGPDIRVALGTVRLNGGASAFAEEFEWTFAPGGRPSGSSAEIVGAGTVTPSVVTDVPGVYRLQLVVRNALETSAPAFVALTAVFGTEPVRFSADIAPIINSGCVSCHSEGGSQSVAGVPVRFDEPLSLYDRLSAYVNDQDYAASLLLSKPAGVRHGGQVVPGFDLSGAPGSERGDYDRVLQWISEGAPDD